MKIEKLYFLNSNNNVSEHSIDLLKLTSKNNSADSAKDPILKDFLEYLSLDKDDKYHNKIRDTVVNYIISHTKQTYGSISFQGVHKESVEDIIKVCTPIQSSQDTDSFFGIYKDYAFIDLYLSGEAWEIKLFGGLKDVTERSSEIQKIVNKHKTKVGVFKILSVQYGELSFSTFKIKNPKINPSVFYGEGFNKHNDKIIESLTSKASGIYMFRGPPGTGKTTYIKYLADATQRPILFVPEGLCERLVSPEIIPLLAENKGAILVLEDAERAISAREGGFSPVSALLNLSDGIMGDFLNIAIIVTYNTDSGNIDPALTRKGRCLYDYEFKKLSVKDAKILAEELGKNPDSVVAEMSLGEVANIEEENNVSEKVKAKIGF